MLGVVHLLPHYAFMACVGTAASVPLFAPLPQHLYLHLPSCIHIQEFFFIKLFISHQIVWVYTIFNLICYPIL